MRFLKSSSLEYIITVRCHDMSFLNWDRNPDDVFDELDTNVWSTAAAATVLAG